jgi:hypothetical protein
MLQFLNSTLKVPLGGGREGSLSDVGALYGASFEGELDKVG